MIRVFSCILLWGWGAEALHGGTVAVALSGIIALAINRAWRTQQYEDARQRHAQDVIADEDLRLTVREKRAKP